MNFAIDWGFVSTTLLMGVIVYLFRQARAVDSIRQALTGLNGTGGLMKEVSQLQDRLYSLAQTLANLSANVTQLNDTMNRAQQKEG